MISVIVPVYNAVDYLEDCLQSIANQGATHELIIVNDGSDDGSEAICRKWVDEGRAVLLQTKREGLSAARNKGIEVAKGEYITFVDSDDKLMPDALETMLAIAQRNPHCGIVEAQLTADENKLCLKTAETVYTAKKAIELALYQTDGHNSSACGKLYRRELFENECFVCGRWYEDLEIFPRIFRRAEYIAITPCSAYYYRPNPGSFINTYTPQRKDMLWATATVLTFITEHYPELVPAAVSRRFSAICNMFNLANSVGEETVARTCFSEMQQLRRNIIFNPRVRLKNKIAAIMSYGGLRFMRMISRIMA